jgi:DNA-binding PadR family transcriptional regulator
MWSRLTHGRPNKSRMAEERWGHDVAGRARTTQRPAIRSAVSWALLGLVIERPSYGYELLKRFEREYQQLLPLSGDSHIYTALNTLQRKGLIEEVDPASAEQPRPERQPKPRYRATPAGERGFLEWVIALRCEDRRQWRLFVRQLAVFARNPKAGLKIIERCEEAYLKELDAAPADALPPEACENGRGLAARLSYEESRLTMAARLPWVEYARSEFRALGGEDGHRFERRASIDAPLERASANPGMRRSGALKK